MEPWIAWIVAGDLGFDAASSSSACDSVKLSGYNEIKKTPYLGNRLIGRA